MRLSEPYTFFVDRSLGGKKVPDALRDAGEIVEPFAKHAAQDTPDETWLKLAGTNGWVVLTGDDRIRYHAAERQALVDAKVAAFILGAGNLTGDQQASVIVAALPEIKRHLRANDVPIVATITKSGAVQLKKNE